MAKAVIGGKEYNVPVMNFKKLKRVWPLFQAAANVDEKAPLDAVDHSIAAISIGLEDTPDAMTVDQIEETLLSSEAMGLSSTIMEMMKESGLVRLREDGVIEGNERGVEVPASSMEILTPSSPNSSLPDAKVEVGTE